MTKCQQCEADLPPSRKSFCSNACGIAYHNASRSEPKQTDVETPLIHLEAQRLVVQGFLPPPFSIDPLDGRPVWSFTELATMFDRRPDELVELLIEAGPVHLAGDRGIPSSWQSLIERYGPT